MDIDNLANFSKLTFIPIDRIYNSGMKASYLLPILLILCSVNADAGVLECLSDQKVVSDTFAQLDVSSFTSSEDGKKCLKTQDLTGQDEFFHELASPTNTLAVCEGLVNDCVLIPKSVGKQAVYNQNGFAGVDFQLLRPV